MITTYSPTVITSLYFCCFLPALYWRAHVQLFLLCWVWSITTGMSVGAYQCSTEGGHPPTLKAHRQREDTYIHTHLPHTQPATSTRQPFGDREQVGQLESLGSPPHSRTLHPDASKAVYNWFPHLWIINPGSSLRFLTEWGHGSVALWHSECLV